MDATSWEYIISFVQGVGFPIFVAAYLLIVIRTTLEDNTAAIHELIAFLRDQTRPN